MQTSEIRKITWVYIMYSHTDNGGYYEKIRACQQKQHIGSKVQYVRQKHKNTKWYDCGWSVINRV